MPSYLKLTKQELKKRADQAWGLLLSCRVCPRKCKVNRITGKEGWCEMGAKPVINSFHFHFGEEAPLVGSSRPVKGKASRHGSGTIFFSSCNLACRYCQNYEISHYKLGQKTEIRDLAKMMLILQNKGCHNINFVSPTIWVPQILKALAIAVDKGLSIPLVYNSGGYDAVKTLKLLDNIVDIYMPDIKYSNNKIAKKYSLVNNYWEVAKKAVREMHSQVGDLMIDENGIAGRGLIVRHLILPNNLAGTEKVMRFLAAVSKDTYLNIMDQYHPVHEAGILHEINRRITTDEYRQAVEIAKTKGLHRFDKEFKFLQP